MSIFNEIVPVITNYESNVFEPSAFEQTKTPAAPPLDPAEFDLSAHTDRNERLPMDGVVARR